MTPHNSREIAGKLTEAQRRAILEAHPTARKVSTGEPCNFILCAATATVRALEGLGLVDGQFSRRSIGRMVTPLGLQVRAVLKDSTRG